MVSRHSSLCNDKCSRPSLRQIDRVVGTDVCEVASWFAAHLMVGMTISSVEHSTIHMWMYCFIPSCIGVGNNTILMFQIAVFYVHKSLPRRDLL